MGLDFYLYKIKKPNITPGSTITFSEFCDKKLAEVMTINPVQEAIIEESTIPITVRFIADPWEYHEIINLEDIALDEQEKYPGIEVKYEETLGYFYVDILINSVEIVEEICYQRKGLTTYKNLPESGDYMDKKLVEGLINDGLRQEFLDLWSDGETILRISY